LRRFLLHVLPSGFHRIRHYGLLANRSARRTSTWHERYCKSRRPPRRSTPPAATPTAPEHPRSCVGIAARQCSSSRSSLAPRTSAGHQPSAPWHDCAQLTDCTSLPVLVRTPLCACHEQRIDHTHRNHSNTLSKTAPAGSLKSPPPHRRPLVHLTPHRTPSNPHSSALPLILAVTFAVSSLEDCPTPTRHTPSALDKLRIGVDVEQSLTTPASGRAGLSAPKRSLGRLR